MSIKYCVSLAVLWLLSDAILANEREFGDWVLHCESKDEVCFLSQIAVIETNGERLMEFNIPLSKTGVSEGLTAEVILPLGTSLDISPKLFIADQFISELRPKVCLSQGCYFSLPLTSYLLERFLSMFSGFVKITDQFKNEFDVPISGTGTRSAYNHFKSQYLTNSNP